jgi:hypothetical protein
MDDVMSRAFAAYFKQAKRDGIYSPDQPANSSSVMKANGHDYAVLANGNGTLAVYRIRNDGMLKRLKRWPAELDR